MTCSPSQTADRPEVSRGRDRIRTRAQSLLDLHGCSIDTIPGATGADESIQAAAVATALMDLFRRTGDAEVFDCLVQCAGPQLFTRVRSRLRSEEHTS